MNNGTSNLALSTANTLTDRKAYDIASWLYDIAQWVHDQGEPPAKAHKPRSAYDRLAWDEYNKAEDKRRKWEQTPAGIMDKLRSSLERTIDSYATPRAHDGTFQEAMINCLENAVNELFWNDCGEAECQKLIERGKFFFSFWMPEPVAAAVVKIRGGTVEEKGSDAAGYTLTPTASTSPRLTL